MELLFAISVVIGAFLLGSFLGKAFVALIQKFSGDQGYDGNVGSVSEDLMRQD